MLARFVALLISHRRLSSLLIFAFALLISIGSFRLETELTGQEFFAHRSDDVARLGEFVERWGDDSNLLIAVASAGGDTILTPARMQSMAGLARAVRAIDGVSGAWSLQEFPRFQPSPAGSAQPAMVLGRAPSDKTLLAAWQAGQLADPLLVPAVLSEDGRFAALIIELEDGLSGVIALRRPVVEIEAEIARSQGISQLQWELAGLPAIRVSLLEVVLENQVRLVPLSMLLVVALLAFLYRRSYAVILPLFAGVSSIFLLLGVMGWTGEPVGLLNQFYFTLIPVIVMVDGVHVIERFASEADDRSSGAEIAKAVVSSYAKVGVACLLTSLTTVIGFASLGFSSISALRHFGFYAGLGVVLGFALVLTTLPLFLTGIDNPRIRRPPFADSLLGAVARAVVARPGSIGAVALCVLLALAGLATQVQSGSTLTGDLPASASASIGGRLLDQHLLGQFRFDIVIEGTELASYAALNSIDMLESRWRKDPGIRSVLGPGTAVRHASRWSHGGRRIPLPDEEFGGYYRDWLNFSELPQLVSEDDRHARIIVTAPDQGTSEMLQLGQKLVEEARQELATYELSVNITGAQWNLYLGYSSIGVKLRNGVLFALAAIMLVMALLFRSAAVSLLMLLPNLLPLLAGYAVLAAAGLRLSIVPAVVLALAVGIVVDDSIHMLARIREEVRRGLRPEEAVQYAILHSGRAIVVSTFVLVAGFAVNAFSRFPINQTFALIGSVVLISALVCDLYLLPALFILWHRHGGRIPGNG